MLSPEQLAMRKDILGASEVAAAIGVSKWKSEYTWFFNKTQDVPYHQSAPALIGSVEEYEIGALYAMTRNESPELLMDWGLPQLDGNEVMENLISLYRGERIPIAGHDGCWLVSPGKTFIYNDWCGGTPDFLVVADDGTPLWGVEAKIAGAHALKEWGHCGDDVPMDYLYQMIWLMMVLDLDRWELFAKLGGTDCRRYEVDRDKDIEEALFGKASLAWDRVVRGEAPPVDGSDSTTATIEAMVPEMQETLRPPTPEERAILKDYEKTVRLLKRLDERKKRARNHLRLSIGPAEGINAGDGTYVTMKGKKKRTLRIHVGEKE